MSQAPRPEFFTIDYGNHRTAAALVMMKQGRIDPSIMIGMSWNAETQQKEALTAEKLYRLYTSGQLLTSNANSQGKPWLTLNKVSDIARDFDVTKFFDAEHNSGKGIIARVVSAEIALTMPRFGEAADMYNGQSFAEYLAQVPTNQIRAGAIQKGCVESAPIQHIGKNQ